MGGTLEDGLFVLGLEFFLILGCVEFCLELGHGCVGRVALQLLEDVLDAGQVGLVGLLRGLLHNQQVL